jgi:5'-nucleotidase
MIRFTRFQPLLLMTLGLVAATVGCGSGGSAGSGGSGGAGGTNGGALRILVTNDDGVGAEGIDAIVEALIANPDNDVVVSAPAGQKSGSGGKTIETDPELCGSGEGMRSSTASGYDDATWAVDGCPADAVNYALDPANGIYAANRLPHVVISGINQGQNVGEPVVRVSGTVGAAKTAARDHGVPALASSQGAPGSSGVYDYPSGVEVVLAWLAEHRAALAAGSVTTAAIDSVNIPSCEAGSIRGALEVDVAESSSLQPQDCESTLEDPQNDLEAFANGYTTLSAIPAN